MEWRGNDWYQGIRESICASNSICRRVVGAKPDVPTARARRRRGAVLFGDGRPKGLTEVDKPRGRKVNLYWATVFHPRSPSSLSL
jgi:hypothetical protein